MRIPVRIALLLLILILEVLNLLQSHDRLRFAQVRFG
jgi:hypothetical protein